MSSWLCSRSWYQDAYASTPWWCKSCKTSNSGIVAILPLCRYGLCGLCGSTWWNSKIHSLGIRQAFWLGFIRFTPSSGCCQLHLFKVIPFVFSLNGCHGFISSRSSLSLFLIIIVLFSGRSGHHLCSSLSLFDSFLCTHLLQFFVLHYRVLAAAGGCVLGITIQWPQENAPSQFLYRNVRELSVD